MFARGAGSSTRHSWVTSILKRSFYPFRQVCPVRKILAADTIIADVIVRPIAEL
jgi:hypothetical protein